MNRFVVLLLVFSSAVLADRPDWYPENAAKIEEECMNKYSVSTDAVAKIRQFHIEDTPAIRSLLFCSAKGKNIYRPDVGFEPERFNAGLGQSIKIDCKIDFIRECAEKYKELEPEEFMYFSTLKCVFDNKNDNCIKIA